MGGLGSGLGFGLDVCLHGRPEREMSKQPQTRTRSPVQPPPMVPKSDTSYLCGPISKMTNSLKLSTHPTRRCPIDTVSLLGWTALGYASFYGRADVVSLLLDAGADPNIANHRLETPIR